jgi:transposase InsO family protein
LRPRRRAAIPSRSRPISRGLVPTGLDQLWVADITYVRLAETFVYLAVVIDAFSRRVAGWALDDHLEARLAVDALDEAIEARDPPPGLIHHSDRDDRLNPPSTLRASTRRGSPREAFSAA